MSRLLCRLFGHPKRDEAFMYVGDLETHGLGMTICLRCTTTLERREW